MSIEIKDLSFTYDDKRNIENGTLQDINLIIENNKITSILGPNGSYKSTLIKLILSILSHKKGTILIDGEDIKNISKRKKAQLISYVPQITELSYDFSVYDVVSMGRYPYIKGLNSLNDNDHKKILEALNDVGLISLKDKFVTELSGGEVQRVSLARALCQDTKYIILDEPINHLDVKYQVDLLEVLKSKVQSKTIICVMHDINLSYKYSQNIVLMKNGRVKSYGDKKEILTKGNLKETYEIDFSELLDEDNNKIFIPKQSYL